MSDDIKFGLGLNTAPFYSALDSIPSKLSSVAGLVKGGFVGLGASIVGAFTIDAIKARGADAKELLNTAKQLGVSTDFFQGFSRRMSKAGVDADSMTASLQKLNIKIGEAKMGNGEAQKAFDKFGISLVNANGTAKTSEQVVYDLSEVIKNIEDPTKRAAIAMEFFGRTGSRMAQGLAEGRGELKKHIDEVNKLSSAELKLLADNEKKSKLFGQWMSIFTGKAAAKGLRLLDNLTSQSEINEQVAQIKDAQTAISGDFKLKTEERVKTEEQIKAEAEAKDKARLERINHAFDEQEKINRNYIEKKRKEEELITKQKEAQLRLSEAEHNLSKAYSDRGRMSLSDLANLDPRAFGRVGRQNIFAARQARQLEELAPRLLVEGRDAQATNLLNRAEDIRKRLTPLTDKERNPMGDLVDAVKKQQTELQDVLDKKGIVVRSIVNAE